MSFWDVVLVTASSERQAALYRDEIERRNQSLGDAGEITIAEFNALPEPARKYIDKLRREVNGLKAGNDRLESRIRRTNWGRSR